MSVFFSCAPSTNWLPFQDPHPEEGDDLLALMAARIDKEEWHTALKATEYECHPLHLKRFLEKNYQDIELALNQWHRWVQWRHEHEVDSIVDEMVQHELNEGVFQWRGQNKAGMLCCVISGRMFDAVNRGGTYSSFRKFLVRFVEEGMKASHERAEDKICIIYDRRGLDYENIDPNLHQFCRRVIEEMREWYSDRIGAVYILHTNWLYYLAYSVLLWPVLSFWSKTDRLVVVEEPSELLQHFDEDKLFLLSAESSASRAAFEQVKEAGIDDEESGQL